MPQAETVTARAAAGATAGVAAAIVVSAAVTVGAAVISSKSPLPGNISDIYLY